MWTTGKVTLAACGLIIAAAAGWLGKPGLGEESGGRSGRPVDTSVTLFQADEGGGIGFNASGGSDQPRRAVEIAGSGSVLSADSISISVAGVDEGHPFKVKVSTNLHPTEERILESLNVTTKIDFPGNPLNDVADFLSDQNGFPILLDTAALEELGITLDHEVRLSLEGVTLRTALKLLLKPHGMAYVVEDEVLKITTQEVADQTLETRIYDVRPLFGGDPQEPVNLGDDELSGGMYREGSRRSRPSLAADPQTLVDVLTHGTSGEWMDKDGGGGEISYFKGSFVIRQTQAVHAEIEKLLNNLATQLRAAEQSPNWPAPQRPRPQPAGQQDPSAQSRLVLPAAPEVETAGRPR